MAFIYCDFCNWSQDDFWSWRYNPVRCFFRRVRDYGRPRMIQFDRPIGRIHSWRMFWNEVANLIKRVANMHWRTAEAWQAEIRGKDKWPDCPRCGRNSLNVD